MPYTLNDIPDEIEKAARERAEREGLSLDQVMVRELRFAFSIAEKPTKKRDLSGIFDGTPLEPEVLEALEDQRRIDPKMWE